jgi:uncharacterized membrane protein YdjX (TVP38/TMEM64 family)
MKELIKKIVIVAMIAIWILSIFLLKENHLLTFDLGGLKKFVSGNANYAMLVFVAFWLVRLLIFIPGATLMVLGGLCFNPLVGFLLSMAGMILSETVVYVFSKAFSRTKVNQFLENKNPKLKFLLETYNYKFLALGIICPIAPTDAICFLSASIGIKYWIYILTVIISNIPLILLYSYIGNSLYDSFIGILLVVLSFGLISAISIKIWNNLKIIKLKPN